jgi:cell division septal protein FtsQ
VGRSWIHGALTIYIEARKPVASFVGQDGSSRYFDGSGVEFQSPISYQNVPVINLAHDDSESKNGISKLLNQLPNEILANAKTFSVPNSNDLQLTMAISSLKTIKVLWGSSSDLSLKIEVLRKLLSMKENSKATIFDLRDPLSPITK